MSNSLSQTGSDLSSPTPEIHWTESGAQHSARWRSERIGPPPKRVVVTDDTITADKAYRLACEGTTLLWRGDFHNAAQLMQAMARRADKAPARKQRKAPKESSTPASLADAFHQYRQAQSQRARILGAVLVPFNADYSIALGRAPDAREACVEAWGPVDTAPSVASLRELQGIIGAREWRKKGVEIPALGSAPNNRIHPHYGVFSPVRGEYVGMVATAPLPGTGQAKFTAFDIGTGTGVLAAVLARRGIETVVATDRDPRALACARENLDRLGVASQVTVVDADLFPDGRASLIVCNPPWLPARPGSPLESAIYDEDSRMLLGFLGGLAAHLAPGGEGWLILSDFAEHLGLRSREELLAAIGRGGLQVAGRIDVKPRHPKAADASDPLHAARAAEVTSLWRLTAIPS